MKTWDELIIEYLYEARKPDFSFVPLKDFFKNEFNIEDDNPEQANKVLLVLTDLKNKGIIEFRSAAITNLVSPNFLVTFGYYDPRTSFKKGSINYHEIGGHITSYGIEYIEQIKREKKQSELLEGQSKSVIDTNISVQKTNTIISNTNKASVVMLIIYTVTTIGIFINEYRDTTAQELQGIRQELQKSRQQLDSLLQSEKKQ